MASEYEGRAAKAEQEGASLRKELEDMHVAAQTAAQTQLGDVLMKAATKLADSNE